MVASLSRPQPLWWNLNLITKHLARINYLFHWWLFGNLAPTFWLLATSNVIASHCSGIQDAFWLISLKLDHDYLESILIIKYALIINWLHGRWITIFMKGGSLVPIAFGRPSCNVIGVQWSNNWTTSAVQSWSFGQHHECDEFSHTQWHVWSYHHDITSNE